MASVSCCRAPRHEPLSLGRAAHWRRQSRCYRLLPEQRTLGPPDRPISMRGNVKRVRLDDTLLSLGLHCNSNHRHFYAMSLREIDGFRVPRIRVPRDTHPGIVGQYAFDAYPHLLLSVSYGDL